MRRLAVIVLLTACDPTTIGGTAPPATEVAASATASPRPLDDGPLATSDVSPSPSSSAGTSPPPEPLAATEPVSDDPLPNRPTPGVRMAMRFRYPQAPAPPALTEVELPRIKREAAAHAPTLAVELMEGGRMRVEMGGATSVLEGTHLLGRRDRFGHLLVWPDDGRYRVVPAGALRALFADGRVDVGTTTTPPARVLPPGEMFGRETTRVAIESVLGSLELELVAEPAAGSAAGLMCRALLDLGAVAPSHELCQRGLVTVAADYRWTAGGGVRIEATSFEPRDDLLPPRLASPPAGARFDATGMPAAPTRHVADDELARWRSKVIDVGPRPEDAPSAGLLAANRSDRWRWLVLDGVPVARLEPWTEVRLASLVPGRYNVRWRGFLGEEPSETTEITTPFRVVDGKAAPAGDVDGAPEVPTDGGG